MSDQRRNVVKINGGVRGQVAVGDHITQTNIGGADDRAAVRKRVEALKEKVTAEAPPERQQDALEQLDVLEDAIVAEAPKVSTMALVRDWFRAHLPKLAGDVTSLIVHPLVGKIVEAAGDLAASRFRAEFGDPPGP